MFGIGVWEMVLIAFVLVLMGGGAVVALIIALSVSAGSRDRRPDDR